MSTCRGKDGADPCSEQAVSGSLYCERHQRLILEPVVVSLIDQSLETARYQERRFYSKDARKTKISINKKSLAQNRTYPVKNLAEPSYFRYEVKGFDEILRAAFERRSSSKQLMKYDAKPTAARVYLKTVHSPGGAIL